MTKNPMQSGEQPTPDVDSLEERLEESDAADAAEVAEEIARQLGDALEHIDSGRGSGAF